MFALALVAPALSSGGVPNISAADLRAGLAERTIRAVIDVRSPSDFAQAHIPGAINVPHFIAEAKSLPPLGSVVVYGGGFGSPAEAEAAAAIGAKPGIHARWLAGGFAAWESAGFSSTHPGGFGPTRIPTMTYEQLATAQNAGIVLVDLRRTESPSRVGARSRTDLKAAFPNARLLEREDDAPAMMAVQSLAEDGGEDVAAEQRPALAAVDPGVELLVLIDDGDGSAEREALRLQAAGNRRVAILAGGEISLLHEGRRGSARIGYGMGEEKDPEAEEIAKEP